MEYYAVKERGCRGIFLMITNTEFEILSERLGSEKDTEKLSKLWSDRGFSVQAHSNCTNAQMRDAVRACAADAAHQDADCFICSISSHGYIAGDDHLIMGTDGNNTTGVNLDREIIEEFCKSPKLVGKPKVFIVQACHGNSAMATNTYQADSTPSASKRTPLWADVLIFESTVPGYKAYRSIQEGSIFITKFRDVMEKYGDFYDMARIGMLISKELQNVEIILDGHVTLQQCQVRATLNKLLYLRNLRTESVRLVIEDAISDEDLLISDRVTSRLLPSVTSINPGYGATETRSSINAETNPTPTSNAIPKCQSIFLLFLITCLFALIIVFTVYIAKIRTQ